MCYGIICVLLTGVAESLGGLMQAAFVFFGVGGGPLLGVFSLGMLSRRCSQKVNLSRYFRNQNFRALLSHRD